MTDPSAPGIAGARPTLAMAPPDGATAAVFPGDSEMARRCRALDWAATPLGPAANWPAALRTVVRTCLESPFPVNLWCGPELVLVYNDAYRRALGAKHPGALGRRGLEVWREIRADLEPMFAQLRAGGPPLYAEDARFVMSRAEGAGGAGEDAYFTFGLSPVRDEAGAVVAFFNPATETTARVRAEMALEAERERLRALVLSVPAPVALHVGPELRFAIVNLAFRQISGGGRDDTGRPVRAAFPELAGQGIIEALERVYATGEPWAARAIPIRYDRRGRGLEDTWFDVRYEPVRDAAGAVVGVLNFAVEVTDQVQARREIERLLAASEAARAQAEQERARATEANQAKSGFLATMSHELRTPINAMLGYTQLLDLGLAGPLTEQQRGYLDRLAASGHHLLGLVNDVLDLSKIEAGEARVAHVDARTGPATGAALDLVRPQATAKNVRLVDARPDDEGVPFVGDESRVRQIVLNLLSNALKFTAAGGAVTVSDGTAAETPAAAGERQGGRLQGGGPWAFVRVADTGVGIPAEEQDRIFDPFHQVESGHTRTAGGTGLGLAISRRLARLMGGDLVVESAPGAGSTFTLWLPAARPADPATDAHAETAADRSARAARDVAALRVPGLGEVGELLRAVVDEVLAAYADRLRADPTIPRGREMRRVQLEDHGVSFLADLAQSLVIVNDAGAEAADLLRDGSAIQRTIAEAHGARRFAQGWDEAAVRRDHQVFREAVEGAVRGRLRARDAAADDAVRVLVRLIDRAEAISVAGWRRAADAAE